MKRIILFCCTLLGLYACNDTNRQESSATDKPVTTALFEKYYQERLTLFPLEATSNGDNRYNDQLYADFTDSYRTRLKTFYEKYLAEARKTDRAQLSAAEQINYDCFVYELQLALKGLTFHNNYTPLEQIGGFHLYFAQLGSGNLIQPFVTVKDYDNWLSRMQAFGPYMDSAVSYFRKGMEARHVLPKALVVKMIPQMEGMVVNDVRQSLFYKPVLNMPASFAEADKERLTKAYDSVITHVVIPAYQKTGVFLKKEYLPVSRTSSGIWDVPGGDAYYQYAVRNSTSTGKTPEEIYNLGLQEVNRIEVQMNSIRTSTGFKSDLKAFFAYLAADKKFMPFHSAEEILTAYRQIHERMKPQLKKLFLQEPKTPFEIRQVEAYRAKSGSSQYFQGSPDGTRPGIFYVLILDPAKYNAVEEQMESLFLHEAIPGHHYQISLQQEDTTLPDFRRFSGNNNAYVEGWALYCESLGKELGLYTDPYQHMGALGAEMHRAIRLVVDAGMHARKMTREEAIRYMTDHEQISTEAATIEIERYMAWPGQALGYKVGALTISRLRTECAAALGTKFDIAAFHNEVLRYGSMPLDILEKHINEWTARQKEGK